MASSAGLRHRTATPTQTRTHSSHTHSHSHSHGDEETQALLSALSGSSDPGSRITLVGLGANVGLTITKGVAGWLMASAALLADAAHSGSDLLADIVTLTTYRMSRRPVSASHPYGYGKYESLGSLVVSFLLIGTALGIGLHSYHLLLSTLSSMPHTFLPASLLASLDSIDHHLPAGHSHGAGGDHGHGHVAGEPEVVDPNAMWFAAGSIVVKEWLYRATLKVAKSQHSNVLLANALHHRSDAFGSLVAVGAIAGAWMGYPVLDPLGGLLVSGMILKQGAGVGVTALKELTDQVTDATLPPQVHRILSDMRDPSLPPLAPFQQDSAEELHSSTSSTSASESSHKKHDGESSTVSGSLPILEIPSIRTLPSGPTFLIDIQLVLPSSLTLSEAGDIEAAVKRRMRAEWGARVREVVVRMRAGGEDDATK